MDSGIMPSISSGFGYSDPSDTSKNIKTWYVGLEWSDVLVEGNSFGGAFGQAPNVIGNDDDEDNYLWEAFYSIAVSDNITVTPTIFGISPYTTGGDDDIFGALREDHLQVLRFHSCWADVGTLPSRANQPIPLREWAFF
jgi:hypothetical protein